MKHGLTLLCVAALAACSTATSTHTLIPNKSLNLSPSLRVPLEAVAATGVAAVIIYLVYDPLAPNWEIQEQRLADDTYRFDLRMKRYHTGGAGEAMQVLRRRAAALQREQGFGDYQLVEYSEGIESQTLGAQRVAEATVRLLPTRTADSFLQNGR